MYPKLKPKKYIYNKWSKYQYFVQQSAESCFISLVIFTDAHFGRDGIINIKKHHQRAEENPHGVIQSRHLQQISINVWVVTGRPTCFATLA
jgi:hypothetical protein